MKYHAILAATLLQALLAAFASADTSFYVAPNGSDQNPGTIDLPFATLHAARDAARRLQPRPAGSLTIFVRAGTYCFDKPLTLNKQDSGSPESPILYRAFPNEKPTLIGGRLITQFQPYKDSILKADLAAQGFPKNLRFQQLFFAGQRQHLARYPNYDPANPYAGGWAYVEGKRLPMYAEHPTDNPSELHYAPVDARHWARPQDGSIFIFPRFNWWNNILPIASIDPEKRLITLTKPGSYAIRPGDRYYAQGLLEELDAPGEWYLDSASAALYFWPPSPITPDTPVYAPTLRTIVQANNVSNITFQGFTIECVEGDAIQFKNCSDCLIAANTIRNVGDYHSAAVAVSGGHHVGVCGNDISHTGSTGISLYGGDRPTLTPADHYADNNYIHHVGVFYKQGIGISLNGVGIRASHNLIHDCPRFGIQFSGNNLLLEYNHIRHVSLETEDTGVVYTGGRDWISSRGTIIRYNFFHDSLGFGHDAKGKWKSPFFAWGVYLDDNTGGVQVIGNIIARCARAGMHLHNSRDILVENNVLIDNGIQQFEISGWLTTDRMWKEHLPTMIKGYESVASQPAWKNMPHMDLHPTQAPLPDGKTLRDDVFRNNIVYWTKPEPLLFRFSKLANDYYKSDANLIWHFNHPLLVNLSNGNPPIPWDDWKKLGFDQTSLVADPLFVDPSHDDYRLRPESPALKLGFKPIPIDQIGPYSDPLRASWPIQEAPGVRENPIPVN